MSDWVDFKGRSMPVTPATVVLIMTATQSLARAERSARFKAEDCNWNLTARNPARIVAYKVVG